MELFVGTVIAGMICVIFFYLWRQIEARQFFAKIPDKYQTYAEVQEALRRSGLESSELIIGIDYTKSNEWTGGKTFGGRCLHEISPHRINPYQTVISVIGRTLEPFDEDHFIPTFGFGDVTTKDKAVFPFFYNRVPHGLNEVLTRYNELTPQVQLSGPTNFAPLIYEAINIVYRTSTYHILLIIADGQVSNVEETSQAIVDASKYPLSIIMIGVGDGPWEKMREFDDELPARQFDNFQFVPFDEVMRQSGEIGFAVAALMEVPKQFKLLKKLRLISSKNLPPPQQTAFVYN